MPPTTRANLAARNNLIAARLEERDDYGLVLVLILATIFTLALGQGQAGQFISVCLSGFTLLFVLHTSDARRRSYRGASVIVAIAIVGTGFGLLFGADDGTAAAGLIGLLLAFAAPVVILRHIFDSPIITVRLVLGALSIYLLLGLTYAYLYPVIAHFQDGQFFVQTTTPGAVDFVYFSYVTQTTVGYGDFTAATSVGRMVAVSEALVGQLYLVSAVALLVGNIGRSIVRGPASTGVKMEPESATDDGGPANPPA
jgi:hypothetical protein